VSDPIVDAPHFDAGGGSPYATALRSGGGMLRMIDHDGTPGAPVELARFLAAADDADRSVLDRSVGAILDVGCGPGRMVRAAIVAGHLSLGVDVSDAAVTHAHEQGLPVLRRSVFDTIPREGKWGTALLLDGNIGIGGNPADLLVRCAQLVQPGGLVAVEVHPDPRRDRAFRATLIDHQGRSSLPFPWYEIGEDGVRRCAAEAGLRAVETWAHADRTFVLLRREMGPTI
jgi:SAM-dependent methyltransferase